MKNDDLNFQNDAANYRFGDNPAFDLMTAKGMAAMSEEEIEERMLHNASLMMNTTPPPTDWGFEVRYTNFGGETGTVRVSGCATYEEAIEKAFNSAIKTGWTPPRWWQWWRWRDTRDPRR